MSTFTHAMMKNSIVSLCLIFPLFLTACNKEVDSGSKPEQKESVDPSIELKEQIQAQPIKAFAATVDDAHDIALLQQYERDFDQLSEDLDAELKQLRIDNNLTEDMENQRKRDLIQSSLTMLKDLDLKTEQGRYIQGLFYQYWENQIAVYNELEQSPENELKNPKDAIENMSDYYTAQAQLNDWAEKNNLRK